MINGILIDIEGNLYSTIKIGSQIWMAENLRVTYFQNGDEIKIAQNREQCLNSLKKQNSAVYISPSDETNYMQYGLLYNSNAIFDSRDLAPEGWRIPTLDDWKLLVDFLGGPDIAGTKLKSQTGWKRETNQPSTYHFKPCQFGGTNDSGFSALPSGRMQPESRQQAYDVGMYAWYWAANQKKVSPEKTWYGYFTLNYYKGNVISKINHMNDYLSIRCIKN